MTSGRPSKDCLFPFSQFNVKYYMMHTCKTALSVGIFKCVSVVRLDFELVLLFRG